MTEVHVAVWGGLMLDILDSQDTVVTSLMVWDNTQWCCETEENIHTSFNFTGCFGWMVSLLEGVTGKEPLCVSGTLGLLQAWQPVFDAAY